MEKRGEGDGLENLTAIVERRISAYKQCNSKMQREFLVDILQIYIRYLESAGRR